MIEHAFRIGTQERTREGLKGPFFPDYKRSVSVPGHSGAIRIDGLRTMSDTRVRGRRRVSSG